MKRLKPIIFHILIVILVVILLGSFWIWHDHRSTTIMVMGGQYSNQSAQEKDTADSGLEKDLDEETYFRYVRPSHLPVLNDRAFWKLLDSSYGKKKAEITIPDQLLNTPEDTILNYFSILRDAAKVQEGKRAGCGTIGQWTTPYPVAYNFLSSDYQTKLPYEEYLNTFQNILHINLIKYIEIPVYYNQNDIIRYFVEIETIEGTQKGIGSFVYYYGFIDLIKEGEQYRISNLEFFGENYLCAPFHGWSYDAEGVVQVKYGGWCKMIKKLYPTEQKDYIKNISFMGNNGNEYKFVFFQLTNGTDIEIAQLKKEANENWKLVKIDPEKCLEDRK